jgi:hypothetical protein
VSDKERRALEYFAQRNGLWIADLTATTINGTYGVMVVIDRVGEDLVVPSLRYYFPHDTDEMLRVPGEVESVWEFEVTYLLDPIRRAVLCIEVQAQAR